MPLKPNKTKNQPTKKSSGPPKDNKRSASSSVPSNWPQHLPYYTVPLLSPALSRTSDLLAISSLNLLSKVPAAPPSTLVKIKPISSSTHPANGQAGLFALRTLPARSWVIDYIGFYHTLEESDPTSDYDISLDREAGVAVDAAKGGNEARFVNDYRGVSERANVEFENRRVGGQMRIAVMVGPKDIKKGEELLVSYGKGFWDGRK
ncbi:hypothetical protein BZA77DRAFT_317403 [Pyronema omphalodes]|nr:hypothetical protein BZA77DRAFT_317403 [Pyronema omphalodes]